MNDKKAIYKKDLDEIQSAFEKVKASGKKFVHTFNQAGQSRLLVCEEVSIQRKSNWYLVISMWHKKTDIGSAELQMTCLEDGENPSENAPPIDVTDQHIWVIDDLGQGKLIYPKEE